MADQPSRDKAEKSPAKPSGADKSGAKSDKPSSASSSKDSGAPEKKAPVVRVPGVIGPMEPKEMGPSTAGLVVILLLVVGLGVGWVLGRMRLHQVRETVATASGMIPDKLRQIEIQAGGVSKKDIVTTVGNVAADAGAFILGDVEVIAERMEFEVTKRSEDDKTCKATVVPDSYKDVPLTERTLFQVQLAKCAMPRWVVAYKAAIPIKFFVFKDTYVVQRTVLVGRYAEDGEFEEEDEEEAESELHSNTPAEEEDEGEQ